VRVVIDFDAVDVSAVSDHVMALARDGSVYTWGPGDRGQLGIGALPVVNFATRTPSTMNYVPYPVQVPNLSGVKAISAGIAHSLALLSDGTVRAWGSNKQGQLGDGTTTDRNAPLAVQGVRDAVAIAAGSYFSVAVLADGTVMQWGDTDGSNTPRPVPAPVPGARDIRSVVAGLAHVVAVTRAGTIVTWGDSTHYQTGRGRNATAAPALVAGLTGVESIATNDETSTAVLSSGRIMTWGEVRAWTRPDSGGGELSPFPILLWIDGLDQA
jgi:alpha-tubulin suppressor-like RCC1 family protein